MALVRETQCVKVYSMPAIGRMNVHTSAHVGRRRISPMEETAECPDAVGDFAAMAIDRLGCSIVSGVTRRSWTLAGRCQGWGAVPSCNRDGEADVQGAWRRDTRKRPRVGRVAAKPTVGSDIGEPWSSCVLPVRWGCADWGAAREHVDDDHRRAAVAADEDGPGSDGGVR